MRYVLALAMAAALAFPTAAAAKKVTRTFTLAGVRTAHDLQRIETAVATVPGVASATTRRNAVTITYDTRRVTPARLREAVHGAGKKYHLGAPAEVTRRLPRKKARTTG